MSDNPIRIINQNFDLLAEIDDYESLIITRDYYKGGSLELKINRNKNNVEFLQKGNIIFPFNQRNKPFIINFYQLQKQNGKQDETITIKAIHLVQPFNRRITVPPAAQDTENYTNTNVETIIKNYINSNVVNPTSSNRQIPLYSIAADQSRGPLIDDQTRYKDLFKETVRLSEAYDLGQQIVLDFNTNKAVYDVFEGLDRTFGQTTNPVAVFSPGFGNVERQEVIQNEINYKNTAYTGGTGEGSTRTIEIVNDTNTGLDRLETFVDARDVSSTSELQDRGFQRLQSFVPIETFNGQILNTSNTKYETDWNLGDIVTLEDIELNIRVDKRIIEVKEIYEGGRPQGLQVNFGKPIDTIQTIIKRELDNGVQETTK